MYLVQTVTSRPRAWSSYTNVNAVKDDRRFGSMNGVEEIPTYRQHFIEPHFNKTDKTAATTYDFPEHPPRKEKKWSFGNLFRRKKKDGESSSDDDDRRIFRKKRKPKKPACAFDHIVVPPHSRGSYTVSNGRYEDGVLSDQSGGFGTYATRPLPKVPDGAPLSRNGSSLGSADSLDKRSRRERTKARAVARRDSQRRGSSSDEDSAAKFRSDESLATRQRDGSLSRRSRVARTERYIRRLSKDDESILNREALQRQARENWHFCGSPPPVAKSSECPLYGASGVFTIPPSNAVKEPRNCFNIRSLSCEANIHKSPSPESQTEVLHVQLPIGRTKYRLVQGRQPPPPPPPRDPRRLIGDPPKANDGALRARNWHAGYRTASEDHIPTEPRQPLAPRPASVTNETRHQRSIGRNLQEPPEKFQYLTEKKPRSRRPIFIQSTDRINTSTYNAPKMFTAQTHVQTKIFLPSVVDTVDAKRPPSPFKPIANGSVDDLVPSEELRRKSANLEEALDELEAIYKSLHLGDEDLLERAEERERSIAAKKVGDAETYPLSDSNFAYEPYQARKRRPALRKSQTLDRRNDDMAYRKLNRDRSNTIATPQNAAANVSYLLASPILSPVEMAVEHQDDEPDVTLDDVVYRNLRHANNSLKVVDPQPPFGIPIGPIALAPNSDYLHAVPENTHRYNFKQKKVPDIVKDDLAFRNLRKDPNKEPALKPERNGCKKLRAVRSLSANISGLVQNDVRPYKRWEVEDTENSFKKASLTDIADAMEIARQILRDKENKIAATKRAFLSDTEAKYRNNLGSSTETITRAEEPSFEDMLTALAVEARETSERITNELNNLDDDFGDVSEHTKLCEKLRECVVGNAQTPEERVESIENIPESVANVVTTRDDDHNEPSYENLEPLPESSDASRSPFEERKAELIATFKELGDEEQTGGEKCVACRECAYVTIARVDLDESGGVASYTSSCDIYVSDEVDPIPPSEGLKSPRLVTSAMKAAKASGSTDAPRDRDRVDKKTRSWYGDPVVLAFACSYGVACSYQLASLDVVALLGLLFVIISIAAALMLE